MARRSWNDMLFVSERQRRESERAGVFVILPCRRDQEIIDRQERERRYSESVAPAKQLEMELPAA